MPIKGMHLSWISVSDFKKAKSFFVDTLGLQASNCAEEWGWMELSAQGSGCKLGVGVNNPEAHCTDKNSVLPGQNAVVTMTVDDIVKTKADFQAKGVTFLGDIMVVPGHVKLVYFIDPDGNKFQLVQELEPIL